MAGAASGVRVTRMKKSSNDNSEVVPSFLAELNKLSMENQKLKDEIKTLKEGNPVQHRTQSSNSKEKEETQILFVQELKDKIQTLNDGESYLQHGIKPSKSNPNTKEANKRKEISGSAPTSIRKDKIPQPKAAKLPGPLQNTRKEAKLLEPKSSTARERKRCLLCNKNCGSYQNLLEHMNEHSSAILN